MSSVKDAIDEMIEESYLLGLSEEEIRRDFLRFIDTCYQVIHANLKDGALISSLTEDLAREKTCILIADRASQTDADGGHEMGEESSGRCFRAIFAEQVARRKRMILKTIGGFDPRLVRLIDQRRFQANLEEAERNRSKITKRPSGGSDHRLLMLKIGYALTVALIILLIYLGFTQKP